MFFHELARRHQNTLNAAPTAFKGSGKTATDNTACRHRELFRRCQAFEVTLWRNAASLNSPVTVPHDGNIAFSAIERYRVYRTCRETEPIQRKKSPRPEVHVKSLEKNGADSRRLTRYDGGRRRLLSGSLS
jgi:hypothetical protein